MLYLATVLNALQINTQVQQTNQKSYRRWPLVNIVALVLLLLLAATPAFAN